MKYCKKCEKQKDNNCFHKDNKTIDGLYLWCKECQRQIDKKRRQKPEVQQAIKKYLQRPEIKKRKKEYEQKPQVKYYHYKRRATKRNHTFDITLDQFIEIINQPCTYCGEPGLNGIDRKNNDEGYTPNNSVPCCFRCNQIKMDYSVKETFSHILKMIKHDWFKCLNNLVTNE